MEHLLQPVWNWEVDGMRAPHWGTTLWNRISSSYRLHFIEFCFFYHWFNPFPGTKANFTTRPTLASVDMIMELLQSVQCGTLLSETDGTLCEIMLNSYKGWYCCPSTGHKLAVETSPVTNVETSSKRDCWHWEAHLVKSLHQSERLEFAGDSIYWLGNPWQSIFSRLLNGDED